MTTEKSIALQTRQQNDIPNYQITELSAFESAQIAGCTKGYGFVKVRSDPSPVYNCHGFTFASRRTGIYDAAAIHLILNDDLYEEVVAQKVLPGDVIIYFSEDGDVEHSGVVVSDPDDSLGIPLVCSKWGKFGEVVHRANMCPYSFGRAKYFRVPK